MALKKAFKTKWLKALRSGKNKQTRTGMLYNSETGGFCCLGVACKIGGVSLAMMDGESLPTYPFQKKVGLDEDVCDKLVDLNDKAHYSFKRIADWIEKHL